MAIIQEAFYIPDDIAIGLASGLYRRIGGIVRYATGAHKGQIVKHLVPIPEEGHDVPFSIAEKVLRFGRRHKKLMVGTMIVVTVSGGIVAGVNYYKKKSFQNAFNEYINAVKTGNMSIDIIEGLEATLANVDSVNMKASEMALLVEHIKDYTYKLADSNSIIIDLKETNTPIVDLRNYLKTQKKIFKEA